MQIEDIVKSIQLMTTEEIEGRLREIRHSRSQVKEIGSKPSQRPTKKSEKVEDEILDLFGSLSGEEQMKLFKELGV